MAPLRSSLSRLCWLAVLGCVLVAAGCEAVTPDEQPDVPGASGTVGSLVLDDVYIYAPQGLPEGADVPVRGAVTNNGDSNDRLVSATTPVAKSVELLAASGKPAPDGLLIAPNTQLNFEVTQLVRLHSLTGPLASGAQIDLTFRFQVAGDTTLSVPVGPLGFATDAASP